MSAESSNLSVGHFHRRFQRSFGVLETWSKVRGELFETYKLKAADNSINERTDRYIEVDSLRNFSVLKENIGLHIIKR